MDRSEETRHLAVAAHQTSAPPPKEKKDRKKLDAAKAIDRPKTICTSRRKPPDVSPKARLRPVTMMRSEEHTSELQSLMRISYAVFCLTKKTKQTQTR